MAEAKRTLLAILAADVVGYSRLMGDDERATMDMLNVCRDVFRMHISDHGGRVVDTAGDSVLATFPSVVEAAGCAVEVQGDLVDCNADLPESRWMQFRIGVNLGDVFEQDDGTIYGDGVNVAARLEGLAEPGGIAVSEDAYRQVEGKTELGFEDIGEHAVKNISRPVRAYLIRADNVVSTAIQAPLALPDKPSIAVLPFDNLSGDPEQEYFADGVAEDIITGLSKIRWLFVIARNSSFTYKGQSFNVNRVGRELGVRYVLEGSVRRGGNRVRVTAQLIETETDHHVWADRYDGTLDDIFELQDEITAKIISALGPELTMAEVERTSHERTRNFNAWDRYLMALQPFYDIDKPGYERATALLHEAIELDPQFSTAFATLARCHVNAALHGWAGRALEMFSKGEDCARKAVALDEQDPFAHVALGYVYIFTSEHGRGVNELNRALQLNPNLSIAHGYLISAFGYLGQLDDALAAADQANRGSPRDPERYIWYMGISNAYFAAERYEECVRAGEQLALLKPNLFGGHGLMAVALPYLGRIEEAKEAAIRAREMMPRLTLRSIARNPLFTREADVARMLEGWRQAGLPE
jgi:TolB-like protein/class 3 adenylate cyclase